MRSLALPPIVNWPTICSDKSGARDQLPTFCDFPGMVDATNNVSERALRPSVIQRKVTNGYRAKWAADAQANLRTTVDTARLAGANPFQTILAAVSA